jgi:hypothetical protein
MLLASNSARLRLSAFLLVVSASFTIETGCSSGNDKNVATGGATTAGSGGAHSGGTQASSTWSGGAQSSGGRSATSTSGASTKATGGNSCIPTRTDIPADHPTEDTDNQPCSSCHGTAIAGGFVFDPSGSTAVSGATVTIKPTSGGSKTAVTGSKGMFRLPGDISSPFEACVSKCPDTVCSKVTDHQNAGDCGTCHGVTASKIHLP